MAAILDIGKDFSNSGSLWLLTWREAMEDKMRVNAGKATIMICGTGLDLLQSSGELPCAVCHTGVGSNSIFCNSCKHWVHKKCSGLKRLTKDPDYRCMPFGQQTTEGSPSGTWPVGVRSSFLLLPWRHALSSRRLWTFNHNTCKPPRRSTRSCYQFSLPTTALSKHIASWTACVQSTMLHAS